MNSNPTRISIPATLAYAGFLTAIVYLLYFHLAPDAPMHSHGIPPAGLAGQNATLHQIDSFVAAAANGRGVEYRVNASPLDWDRNGRFFTTAYYSAAYTQYPNRVWVGDGSTIINFPADLQRAVQPQNDAWLHQHNIAAAITLIPGDQNGPQILIHPVP